MGWAEVVVVALVIVIALLFLLNRAARPLNDPGHVPMPAVRPSIDSATAGKISDLVSRGKKIDAIKELRQATSLGLRDAKDWIDNWDGGGSATTTAAPTSTAPAAAPNQDVLAIEARAVRDAAGPIAAIKFVRERTGWGLAEAKAYIDQL